MDTNLLSMSQQFSGLPMESLIGGPLNAAAKANSAMALTQTRFMLDTCFNRKEVSTTEPKSYQYEPIMIDMILTRSVIGPGATEGADPVIKPASTKFTLPLLTILPINSLAVETVDINFEMEVKSSFSEDDNKAKESESKGEGSFETKLGWGPLSVSTDTPSSERAALIKSCTIKKYPGKPIVFMMYNSKLSRSFTSSDKGSPYILFAPSNANFAR